LDWPESVQMVWPERDVPHADGRGTEVLLVTCNQT
jgi:hypothetical protein